MKWGASTAAGTAGGGGGGGLRRRGHRDGLHAEHINLLQERHQHQPGWAVRCANNGIQIDTLIDLGGGTHAGFGVSTGT